jgi:prephenate dehydrogenase
LEFGIFNIGIFMNIYIIGIGLVGGSIALDLKSHFKEATFFGIDSNESNLAEAIQLGIIHQKANFEDLENADLVIVSVPVDVGLVILPQILDKINDNALVIDVGSTKFPICEVVENHQRRRNF